VEAVKFLLAANPAGDLAPMNRRDGLQIFNNAREETRDVTSRREPEAAQGAVSSPARRPE
jgi:hypothetical protein